MKTCILKKDNDTIDVTVHDVVVKFVYHGKTQPLPGWYPGDIGAWNEENTEYPNFITTDHPDGKLIWEQHIKQGFKIATG